MADIVGPAPQFRFVVTGGPGTAGFSKVTGLNDEIEAYTYREGNDPSIALRQIPGLKTGQEVVFHKGITDDAVGFWCWHKDAEKCSGFRRTLNVTINHCDGTPGLSLNLKNAWARKMTISDLDAGTSGSAIIEMTVVHEGIDAVGPRPCRGT